jgi:hypothetical protein
MKESLVLFDEIANSHYFSDTPIILFCNKEDLFREKIKNIPLTVCFDDFKGPAGDFESAVNFIRQKFLSLNKEERQVYSHVTCATDTRNIKNVFDNVKEIIIKDALNQV